MFGVLKNVSVAFFENVLTTTNKEKHSFTCDTV